jgi:hypothetical protein
MTARDAYERAKALGFQAFIHGDEGDDYRPVSVACPWCLEDGETHLVKLRDDLIDGLDGMCDRCLAKAKPIGRRLADLAAQNANGNGHVAPSPLSFVRLDTVEMRSIEWLEKPLWQRSCFELLVGRKNAGKGTYLCHLAARMTRGEVGERRTVIFISSEDSPAVDLKPRLAAAGADMARIVFITSTFRLPDDAERLRATIAAAGDVAMVVIDPLGNHVGRRKSNDDGEVREAISPLNELSDEADCLVVGVRHISAKDATRGALASILGSSAWIEVPRAVVGIAHDDEDKDVRHVQVIAGNRSATGGGVAFRVEPVLLEGLTEPVTLAVPLGASTKDIDILLEHRRRADASNSQKARDLILDLLEASPDLSMGSDELDRQVAMTASVQVETARNLRGQLKKAGLIRYSRTHKPDGTPDKWFVHRTATVRP